MVHKKNNLLSETDKEKFKRDALRILTAINNGELVLDPDEEEDLRNEIERVLNSFDEPSEEEITTDSNTVSNDNFNQESEIDSLIDDVSDESVEVSDDLDDLVVSVDDVSDESVEVSDDLDDLVVSVDDVSDESVEVSGDLDDLVVSVDDVSDESVEAADSDVSAESVDDAIGSLIDDYSNDVAIRVKDLSMEFRVSKDKIDTLKEFVIRTIKRNKSESRTIVALKNISFDIKKGERVGIIGFNGAGKSTLLKLLAKVYYPTGGTIETKGRIAPLLELGAGFDQNYSGKNNIFLNGAFLGYSEEFIEEKYDEIVEFSELGDAIDYHVKTYSSGMRAKLGFSIATIVEPDILIIDEILSVGDIKFKRKSADKIRSLINSGVTVLLVSHSVNQIRDLCNKAIWIDDGELKMMGDVDKVCDAYVEAARNATKDQLKNIELN